MSKFPRRSQRIDRCGCNKNIQEHVHHTCWTRQLTWIPLHLTWCNSIIEVCRIKGCSRNIESPQIKRLPPADHKCHSWTWFIIEFQSLSVISVIFIWLFLSIPLRTQRHKVWMCQPPEDHLQVLLSRWSDSLALTFSTQKLYPIQKSSDLNSFPGLGGQVTKCCLCLASSSVKWASTHHTFT